MGRFVLYSLLLAVLSIGASHALAQTAPAPSERTQATDADETNNPALSDAQKKAQAIKRDPQSLLKKFPKGGPAMAQHVAEAVVADPGVVDALTEISQLATPAQAAAIGAGLARATRTVDKKTAAQINQTMADADANRSTRITFNALGPAYNPSYRPIVDPVKIGIAPSYPLGPDYRDFNVIRKLPSDSLFNINPGLFSLLASGSYFFTQSPGFEIFGTPGIFFATLATEANDKESFSTSPTQ